MGSFDFGTQDISLDFFEPANSAEFNVALYKLFPKGIYSGFTLSSVNNTTVRVAVGTAYCYDDAIELGVRLETTAVVDLTVSSVGSTHYVVIRFDWIDTELNYADFLVVEKVGILSDDIILGRVCFTSTTMDTDMDYTLRTQNIIQDGQASITGFRIIPTEPATDTVDVSSGTAIINGQTVTFAGTTSGTISGTTAGRIDLVCIDEDGSIIIIEGVDDATPASPLVPSNVLVIGSITRGATKTAVKGNEITQLNNLDINAYNNGNSVAYNISGNLDYDDLNPGTYYHDGTGVLANNPASTAEVIIVSNIYSASAATQEVISLTSNIRYFRSIDVAGGVWSAWQSSEIINDLTTGGTAVPLSAEQGKVLEDSKMDLVGSPVTNNLIQQDAGGNSVDAGYALDNTGVADGHMVVWDETAKTLKSGGSPGGLTITLLGTEQTLVSSGATSSDANYPCKCICLDNATENDGSAVTRMWLLKITMTQGAYVGGVTIDDVYMASGVSASTAAAGSLIISNEQGNTATPVVRTLLVPHGTHNFFVDHTVVTGGARTYTIVITGKEIQYDAIVYSSIV